MLQKNEFYYDIESILKDKANGGDHVKKSMWKLGKKVLERGPPLMARWHPSQSREEPPPVSLRSTFPMHATVEVLRACL